MGVPVQHNKSRALLRQQIQTAHRRAAGGPRSGGGRPWWYPDWSGQEASAPPWHSPRALKRPTQRTRHGRCLSGIRPLLPR